MAAEPPTRILMLTTFDLDEYVFDAMRAGASGFLLKDVRADQLASGVRMVTAGDALLAPSITRRLIEEFAGRPSPEHCPELDELTPRELEVLRLMAAGRSNAEIAVRPRDRGIDGQDARRTRADEARRPRPRAGRRRGIRGGRRHARPVATFVSTAATRGYPSIREGARMEAARVAVITAGGSGMGAAAARRLAADGFAVAILSSSGKGEAARHRARRRRGDGLQPVERRPPAAR